MQPIRTHAPHEPPREQHTKQHVRFQIARASQRMRVYVCECVCHERRLVHLNTYTCMCAVNCWMCASVRVCICVLVHVSVGIALVAYACVRAAVQVCIFMCIRMCMFVYTCAPQHVCACVCNTVQTRLGCRSHAVCGAECKCVCMFAALVVGVTVCVYSCVCMHACIVSTACTKKTAAAVSQVWFVSVSSSVHYII